MGKFIKSLVLAVFLTSVSFAYVSASPAPQGTMKPSTDKKEKKGKKKGKKEKKDKKAK